MLKKQMVTHMKFPQAMIKGKFLMRLVKQKTKTGKQNLKTTGTLKIIRSHLKVKKILKLERRSINITIKMVPREK